MASPITAGASTRWRRIRAGLTFVVILAFLAIAFYQAVHYIRNEDGKASAAPTPCTVAANSKEAAPADVTVNVYNATARAGLAADVAAELKRRGFVLGKVTNDPLKRTITGAAEVRFGKNGNKESLTIAHLVSGSKRKLDKRKSATVDLVIGNAFVELKPAPTCAPSKDE
ncbi:MAG: LytR C-terminal domain-containing protein [Tetrasphaera sp.]